MPGLIRIPRIRALFGSGRMLKADAADILVEMQRIWKPDAAAALKKGLLDRLSRDAETVS